MTTTEEDMRRERAVRWAEKFYDRCAALARSINGHRALACALCEMGRRVACGETCLGERTRRAFVAVALAHVSGRGQAQSGATDSACGEQRPACGGSALAAPDSAVPGGVKSGRSFVRLTVRQREVLQLLAKGKTMKEVAESLGITPRTVAFHKYKMMKGFGLETNADLIRFAIKNGIVSG